MNIEEFSELLERIKAEPSILFLGQKYSASLDGRDFFVEALNSTLAQGRLRPPLSYQQIWDCLGNGKLTGTDFNAMSRIVSDIPTQWWLRRILSLRWGLVYTSAVDGGLVNCTGSDFSMESIGYNEHRFHQEYMNKRHLHGIFLYGTLAGNNGEFPPNECDDRTMRRLEKKVNDRLKWIFDDILSDYGVLVIDGWDPATDWAMSLLHNATAMPYQSIYLFGVSAQQTRTCRYISGLIEDGVLCAEPRTFAQLLAEYGYLDDEEDDLFAWREGAHISGEASKTITINRSNRKQIYLDIPLNALEVLDSSVTVIHDTLGNEPLTNINKTDGFARFLQVGVKPAWPLFNPRLKFYARRKVDGQLIEAVEAEVRTHSSYHRNIIVLEGDSNSGKTTALINLALRLRDKHQYPVIFVNGYPSQVDFADNLKRFIKTWLQKNQGASGDRIDNGILIWDDNNDSSLPTIRQYQKMAKELMECNIVLVGSAYRYGALEDRVNIDKKNGVRHIPISAELSDEEIKALKGVLKDAEPELYERYCRYEQKFTGRPHLLNLFQQLAKFTYSPEWKAVSAALRTQFYREVDVTEADAKKVLTNYDLAEQNLDDVKDAIIEHGFAAAWQIQLLIYQREHGYELKSQDDDEKFQEQLRLKDDIVLLNQVLAMAGQFCVYLPLSLLLRLIRKDGVVFGRREQFITELLRSDSLIRYYTADNGYVKVRFRNPGEAILYVEKHFGHDTQKSRPKEVELLNAVIKACRWDMEGHEVISLVRKFGPNSEGRYGQNVTWGQYYDYSQWWIDIAETIKNESEGHIEAVLVYAHFLREKCRFDNNSDGSKKKYLSDSAQVLREALEKHDRGNKYQFNRLVVEICANLVASMPQTKHENYFNLDNFYDLQKYYKQALANWVEADERQGGFTTNSLLDIWLNAVTNFKNSFDSLAQALADHNFLSALSNSVFYIDRLFDLSTSFDSINLLNKINDIYSWSDDPRIDNLSKTFSQRGNDTYLYLEAWRCWLTKYPKPRRGCSLLDAVRYNLSFLPSDADRNSELTDYLDELKSEAITCAQRSIEVLEGQKDLIAKSKSSRCQEMLIKAKWMVYTKKLILEEKQMFALSRDRWQELHNLCAEYIRYCALEKMPLSQPIQLINALYLWVFTNSVSEALQEFHLLRQRFGSDWFIERIGLCHEETGRLCQFHVNINKNSTGKLTATIQKSIEANGQIFDNVVGRYGIHVSERVLEYLFEGQPATERYSLHKPVVLWFNAQGPTLGIPQSLRPGCQ
jgi:hypothetical protein